MMVLFVYLVTASLHRRNIALMVSAFASLGLFPRELLLELMPLAQQYLQRGLEKAKVGIAGVIRDPRM